MKIVVFSDIHGNIRPLELMLQQQRDADLFISLGDVVNYGPYSNECVDLIETIPNMVKIIGNHEEAFIKGTYNGSHPVAKAFFQHCLGGFDRKDIISKYSEVYEEFDYIFVHTINEDYVYADSEVEFNRNYMIGHSHRQYTLTCNSKFLHNPGSLGQNRINIEIGQYLEFYPKKKEIKFKTIKYDFDTLIREMKERNYPKICTEYFLKKRAKK